MHDMCVCVCVSRVDGCVRTSEQERNAIGKQFISSIDRSMDGAAFNEGLVRVCVCPGKLCSVFRIDLTLLTVEPSLCFDVQTRREWVEADDSRGTAGEMDPAERICWHTEARLWLHFQIMFC